MVIFLQLTFTMTPPLSFNLSWIICWNYIYILKTFKVWQSIKIFGLLWAGFELWTFSYICEWLVDKPFPPLVSFDCATCMLKGIRGSLIWEQSESEKGWEGETFMSQIWYLRFICIREKETLIKNQQFFYSYIFLLLNHNRDLFYFAVVCFHM